MVARRRRSFVPHFGAAGARDRTAAHVFARHAARATKGNARGRTKTQPLRLVAAHRDAVIRARAMDAAAIPVFWPLSVASAARHAAVIEMGCFAIALQTRQQTPGSGGERKLQASAERSSGRALRPSAVGGPRRRGRIT